MNDIIDVSWIFYYKFLKPHVLISSVTGCHVSTNIFVIIILLIAATYIPNSKTSDIYSIFHLLLFFILSVKKNDQSAWQFENIYLRCLITFKEIKLSGFFNFSMDYKVKLESSSHIILSLHCRIIKSNNLLLHCLGIGHDFLLIFRFLFFTFIFNFFNFDFYL